MKRTILLASFLAAFAGIAMFGCNSGTLPETEKKSDTTPSPSGGMRSGDTVVVGTSYNGAYSIDLTLKSIEENKLYIAHSMKELATLANVSESGTPVADFSDNSILIVRGTAVNGKPAACYALTFVEENSYKFIVRIEGDTVAGKDKSWQLCVKAPITSRDRVNLELKLP